MNRNKKKIDELTSIISNLSVRVGWLESANEEYREIINAYENRITSINEHIRELEEVVNEKKEEFDKDKLIENSIRQGLDNIFGYSVQSGIVMPDGAKK